MKDNLLYFGDNLRILKEHIADNSIDLIYLDPPFNSKANYNILFKEPNGTLSEAQITAFEDTWHWGNETEITFQEIINTAPANVVKMMLALRGFVEENDVMAYLTMMCIRLIELRRVLKDTGSIYLHCDPTASHYLKVIMDIIFGKKHFRNEIIWHYETGGAGKEHLAKKHDVILFYTKTDDYFFNPWASPDRRTEKALMRAKNPKGARIKANDVYKLPMDVWNIQALNPMEKERLGYPTQKPMRLLERIINLSSSENGIVLDPFCGCGTSNAVAQMLNRKWIGIDITYLATNLIKWRLKHMFNLEPKKDYAVIGEPEDLHGAQELAKQNRYQFQWWALPLIGARSYGNKKKGADTGIDGYLWFTERDGGKIVNKSVIVQVKSGHVSVSHIRDLKSVIEREKAEIGIFITLEKPTKPMIEEAVKTGFYHSESWGKDYRKIQILTIEELLSGKKPEMPYAPPVYKKAEKHVPSVDELYHGEIQ